MTIDGDATRPEDEAETAMGGGADAATGAAPMPAQPSPRSGRGDADIARRPRVIYAGACSILAAFIPRVRRLRPGGWGIPGGLRGALSPRRSVTQFRCRGGR
eukprot:5423450-Prymnesium_polylepis.1